MAYVSKELKAKIAAALKPVIPKDWKYSLSVRNSSTIVLTIYSAPVNLIRELSTSLQTHTATYLDLNPYHWEKHAEASEDTVKTFRAIFDALNIDNHDRSDIQTDYFDVGHYVEVHIGRWDKPFTVTPTTTKEK